ncbi:hypothetical protein VMF7928_04073 [Vibrio marisflavi CECT 7928]|uniref:Uncharacterized protein n=1 Tax=Vibrio marisflavi CECT 7928 TaxID=634439 RepID=A0ABN8EAI7_9VIBR|nr:hypothetical protein VMF7928_04073 [Vibrio marisflavi CECT 7928]
MQSGQDKRGGNDNDYQVACREVFGVTYPLAHRKKLPECGSFK